MSFLFQNLREKKSSHPAFQGQGSWGRRARNESRLAPSLFGSLGPGKSRLLAEPPGTLRAGVLRQRQLSPGGRGAWRWSGTVAGSGTAANARGPVIRWEKPAARPQAWTRLRLGPLLRSGPQAPRSVWWRSSTPRRNLRVSGRASLLAEPPKLSRRSAPGRLPEKLPPRSGAAGSEFRLSNGHIMLPSMPWAGGGLSATVALVAMVP